MAVQPSRLRRFTACLAIAPLSYLLLASGTSAATVAIVKRVNDVVVERLEAITAKLKAMR